MGGIRNGFYLVCLFTASKQTQNGHYNDPDIQEEGPVFNIEPIQLDPTLHVNDIFGFPAISHALSQTRNARLDIMPSHKVRNEFAILLIMFDHMRARSHR